MNTIFPPIKWKDIRRKYIFERVLSIAQEARIVANSKKFVFNVKVDIFVLGKFLLAAQGEFCSNYPLISRERWEPGICQ